MNNLRDLLNRPLVVPILAFIAGLFIGLVVLGWWIWPVQWTDASARQLRADLQEDYLRSAIDSYTLNGDAGLAQQRLLELGDQAAPVLDAIKAANGSQDPAAIGAFDQIISGVVPVPLPVDVTEAPPAEGYPAPEGQTPQAEVTSPSSGVVVTPEEESEGGNLTLILVLLCLSTLIIAGVLVYFFVFRNRREDGGEVPGVTIPSSRHSMVTPQSYTEVAAETPVVQYLSTYTLGNDLFDDSFSIDSPTGEFLGECGVGISETIGVGDPKKVTAFEVWLFDKNDIQTVTKVLMSEYAFNDPVISQRLASKGEPVLAEPGKRMLLETATLQLEARVVSMNYGNGALPPNSSFDQLTLELAVIPKGVG